MIEFRNVTKDYNGQSVIAGHSFTIQAGELFVMVGQSGSGKTTTLKMINRLVEPTGGTILIEGQDSRALPLRAMRLEMGYVLQSIALFPNLTVRENIELIPEMKQWTTEQKREKGDSLLKKVGLEPAHYADRYPHELSGGEQQRIGIVRAIITEPKILLMDEPFSALDPISREQLQQLTRQLHEELGMTIVFVTHDMAEALAIADRICVMRQGQIEQIATPQVIQATPATEYVEALFHSVEKGSERSVEFVD